MLLSLKSGYELEGRTAVILRCALGLERFRELLTLARVASQDSAPVEAKLQRVLQVGHGGPLHVRFQWKSDLVHSDLFISRSRPSTGTSRPDCVPRFLVWYSRWRCLEFATTRCESRWKADTLTPAAGEPLERRTAPFASYTSLVPDVRLLIVLLFVV